MISPLDFITDPQWTQLADALGTKALRKSSNLLGRPGLPEPSGLPQPSDPLGRPGPPLPVLLIDGPAGTGKTTLARALAEVLGEAHPLRWQGTQVIGMDHFYPGWQGLAAGQKILVEDILCATNPHYLAWDWENNCPGSKVSLDPARPLIVEGCGAITATSIQYADFSIWIELPLSVRRGRALRRDGDMFAVHWDQWLKQEQQHWQQNNPQDLADFKFGETDQN